MPFRNKGLKEDEKGQEKTKPEAYLISPHNQRPLGLFIPPFFAELRFADVC